jgi:acetyl esterase
MTRPETIDRKACKTAVRMRKITELAYWVRRLGRKSAANVRFVETAYGKVRVLEYGFDSPNPEPLHIDMHGGGFVLMSADADEPVNLALRAATGVKVVSIDYPKAPENPYPIAVDAVYEVVLHYVQNAASYGVDTTRIGIGGYSAGANLAVASCFRAKEVGGVNFRYQLLVYPPLDLASDPFLKPTPKKAIPPKMAAMFNACYVTPERASEPYCSPIFATKEQLSELPPTLLILAGQDSLHDEGAAFANNLKEAGVDITLYDFATSAHGFTYKRSSETDRACAISAEFVTG